MIDHSYIHSQALVENGAIIGSETKIWAWAHILKGAKLGSNCNICDHTFIENNVCIGNNVTIKCGVYIWDGVKIEDDVFIGPNVTFTNDKFPRSKKYPDEFSVTKINKGASIGANATILPVEIGEYAMIGAGAVVTHDVPPNAIVVGNPARITGYINTEKICEIDTSLFHQKQKTKTGARIIQIPKHSDMRGELSVIEFNKTLPFNVKRIFYTYNVNSTQVRGEHAHKECEQFLTAISGSLYVIADNGIDRDEFYLDSPKYGLYLPSGLWGIQYKHSSDCILLVCASHEYKDEDYIRNYNDFLRYNGVNG